MDNTVPSPTFCVLPWVHIALTPKGSVKPCCMSNYEVGNIEKESLENIWNGKKLRKIREQMLTGEAPAACSVCFLKEKVTPNDSTRIHSNRNFIDKIKEIKEITTEDGNCSKIDLRYWDFRFSNKCNFKCRSCNPTYSSSWLNDAKALHNKLIGPLEDKPSSYAKSIFGDRPLIGIETVEGTNKYEFLKHHTKELQRVYFAGGEPLIMDEHYFILDMLLEQNRTDVVIEYNTNLSILNYRGKNVLDYWRKWEPGKIVIWPSIDDVGSRAELIRKGTKWEEVENNLKIITDANIKFKVCITVGVFNVFRIPEIVQHLIDINVVNEKNSYSNWYINMITYPEYYTISVLSDKYKTEIIDKLNNFICTSKLKYGIDYTQTLTYTIHQLKQPHNIKYKDGFIKHTKALDEIRNENTFDVIPELNDVF